MWSLSGRKRQSAMLTDSIVSLDLLILLSSSETISDNEIADLFSTLLPSTLFPFASKLREVEEQFHLHHDRHLPSQDLKRAAALDMITRILAEQAQSPFLRNFDPGIDHPTHLDHHLRSDPPPVIALRSSLGLTAPASVLRSTKGEWGPAPAVRLVADLIQSFMLFFIADIMHNHDIDS